MDYLEFIARVTSHIPDKGQVTIRYYGLYANAHQGESEEGERLSFGSADGRAGREVHPVQGLGGDDPEGLRVIDELHPIQQMR